MSSELKFINFIEWCTKLPVADSPRESPGFYLQEDIECLLKFQLKNKDGDWFYNMHIQVEDEDPVLEVIELDIVVGFKKDKFGIESFPLKIKTEGNQLLWHKKMDELKSKLPFDYEKGNWFRFCLGYDSVTYKHKSMEDKTVQTLSYMNANVSVESLPDDFSKMLKTGLNHDAQIKSGKHFLNVHKAVLCARSETFKRMLESELEEGQTSVVQLQAMDLCYFQDFTLYLYTGSMPELTFDKAKTLYEVGSKYSIKSLMLRCSEYLQDTLSLENVFECFLLADAHSDKNFKDNIKTYILDKEVYLEEEYWALFCEKFPKMAAEVCSLSHKRRKYEDEDD